MVLRLADVANGAIDWTDTRQINVLASEREAYRFTEQDILIIRVNGSADLVGRFVAFSPSAQPAVFCDHFIRLRFSHTALVRYVRYLGDALSVRQYIDHNKVCSAGQNTVSQHTIGQLLVPVPPDAEMTRIADRIDELFTDLSAGVAALTRVRKQLKRYRAAVLHAAVTGRLTAEWRKAHGPPAETGPQLLTRILLERRRQWETRTVAKYEKDGKTLPKGWQAKYEEPMQAETLALPELPAGWSWASLDQVGFLQRGRSRHRPRDAAHLYGGPYPFVQTGDIRKANLYVQSHTQTYSEAGLAQSQLWPAGTLCITIAANIAETAILSYPACFPDSVVGFHAVDPIIDNSYIMFFIKSVRERLASYAPATAQKNINDAILSRVAIAVPPPDERAAVIEAVNEKLSQIDAMEAEVERGLARAARLRQAILKAAFEGKLVPQNPADEPAAALLDRIRAERATAGKPAGRRRRRIATAAE